MILYLKKYMSWYPKISQNNISQIKLFIFIILTFMFPISKWYHHQLNCLTQKYEYYTQPHSVSLSLISYSHQKVLSIFPSHIPPISPFLSISTTTVLGRPTSSPASNLGNSLSAQCLVQLQFILHIVPEVTFLNFNYVSPLLKVFKLSLRKLKWYSSPHFWPTYHPLLSKL